MMKLCLKFSIAGAVFAAILAAPIGMSINAGNAEASQIAGTAGDDDVFYRRYRGDDEVDDDRSGKGRGRGRGRGGGNDGDWDSSGGGHSDDGDKGGGGKPKNGSSSGGDGDNQKDDSDRF